MLVVVAGCACVLLYVRDPAEGGPFPACPFRILTGSDCPICGTGRALHQLAHGHVATAFGLNPLALIALGLAALWLAVPTARIRLTRWNVALASIVIVAFWIARNLPWEPLAWMSSVR
jgi:hypothetical protein